MVVNDVNGFALPPEQFVELAVSKISQLWQDHDAYDALSLSSFKRYETDLNWDVFSDRLIEIFSRHI